jgi:hypothetical protein
VAPHCFCATGSPRRARSTASSAFGLATQPPQQPPAPRNARAAACVASRSRAAALHAASRKEARALRSARSSLSNPLEPASGGTFGAWTPESAAQSGVRTGYPSVVTPSASVPTPPASSNASMASRRQRRYRPSLTVGRRPSRARRQTCDLGTCQRSERSPAVSRRGAALFCATGLRVAPGSCRLSLASCEVIDQSGAYGPESGPSS